MLDNTSGILKKITGLTLIEIMLSLTLSLLILILVAHIFLNIQKNFLLQSALSTLQENERITTGLLHADLRLAGYIGCPKLTNNFPLKSFHEFELTPHNKIVIEHNKITVRHVSLQHANLIQDMSNPSVLRVDLNSNFSEGNVLIVSDCTAAEIFQVKKIARSANFQKITSTEPLVNTFYKDAEVSKLEINTYFSEKSNRLDLSGLPLYALYLASLGRKKMELVEGVDSLKIQPNKKQTGIFLEYLFSSNVGPSRMKKVNYQFIALKE